MAIMLTMQAGAVVAQDVPDQRQDQPPVRQLMRPGGRPTLDTICKVSLERFCPELAAAPGQKRNQIICLKPYRSSLPLPCRSAVTAAMR